MNHLRKINPLLPLVLLLLTAFLKAAAIDIRDTRMMARQEITFCSHGAI